MYKVKYWLVILMYGILTTAFGQDKGTVRGVVYDKASGETVIAASVYIAGTTIGTTTNIDGFYSLQVPAGTHKLVCSFVGYDSVGVAIEVQAGRIVNQLLYIELAGIDLSIVNVTGSKEEARSDVGISAQKVTRKQIKKIPSTGGSDLAQYLQILPGVIFTGDQGGQLYIRGGSPVQNKILLDGVTIYNPFHSIGFFSVFETEIIKNVDVLTGGFNAEYGGRTSAVIDITTREGNKKRLSGLLLANPFQSKVLLEGPIKKLSEDGGTSASFILTGKHSYINETSKTLYSYIDTAGLPFSFTDLYGKISINGRNGTKLNLFGFNFKDQVDFAGVADLKWDTYGGGVDFRVVPGASRMLIDGNFSFSNYDISLQQDDGQPRASAINSFNAGLDFSYYGDNSVLRYGFQIIGKTTDFTFTNSLGLRIEHVENATELAGFIRYKKIFGKLVIEPSIRVQNYAAVSETTFEPRLGVKLNISDNFRFKFGGGIYTQDLISSVNDLDIVNLFVGFISSPSDVAQPNSNEEAESRLQRSIHAIGGFEIDVNDNIGINIEPYYKDFPQLISLNRSKEEISDPNFITEKGAAYGIDFLLKYRTANTFLWFAYSLGYVRRNDGIQEYPTNFDRRHNVNLVYVHTFGSTDDWEVSARWNLGTGFPFMLTQSFYHLFPFQDGINSDYVTGNGDLGVLFSNNRNSGRLPDYHRLDLSLKKTIRFSPTSKLEAVLSITNAYDRSNIFFFDRIELERVDQLPILPSLEVTYLF